MLIDRVRPARLPGLLGAWFALTFALGSAGADDKKPAAPKLDGKWVYESQTIGGQELSPARRGEIWIEVKDGSFLRCGKGGLRQELRLTLDVAREPAEFTLVFKHPATDKVSESKGIYKLDGDRLSLCYDNTGRTRPAKFESPDGRDEIVLSVLKRAKE